MPYKDPERQKEAQARYYREQKDTYKQRSKMSRRKKWEKLAEIKSAPCQDCKIQYPGYVMQFDHVRGIKIDKVTNLMKLSSWQAVLDEIAKCDLVCANCHAERTYQRLLAVEGNQCHYINEELPSVAQLDTAPAYEVGDL